MAFFDKYPYTDFHELNLDWILSTIKSIVEDMKLFKNLSSIKYADPIDWNITTQYAPSTIVIDPGSLIAYLSLQAVPAGILITDSDYWLKVLDIIDITKRVYMTPEIFGAKGDGITDDTAAINECLENCRFVILKNKYYINGEVILKNNFIMGGELIEGPSGTVKVYENSSIKFVHFSDTMTQNVYDDIAVIGVYGDNVEISFNTFTDIHREACIYVYSRNNIDTSYNVIDTYNVSGIKYIDGCTNIKVNHNTIINGTNTNMTHHRYPICVSAYGATSTRSADRIECNYNYIEDQTPFWEGIDSHACTNATFKGNIIIGTASGIVLTDPTSATDQPTYNVSVTDNYIDANECGLVISASGIENIEIRHNDINVRTLTTSINNYCIHVRSIDADPTVKDVIITGNKLKTEGKAFYTDGKLYNLVFDDNDIDGNTSTSPAVTFASVTGYVNVRACNNRFGFNSHIARPFRGPSANSLSNEMLIVDGNKFGNVDEQYRDLRFINSPTDNISLKYAGTVGTIVPHVNMTNAYAYVAITDADVANNIPATWKEIALT